MAVLGGSVEEGAVDGDDEVAASAGREWSMLVRGSTTRSLEAVMTTRPSVVVITASPRTAVGWALLHHHNKHTRHSQDERAKSNKRHTTFGSIRVTVNCARGCAPCESFA